MVAGREGHCRLTATCASAEDEGRAVPSCCQVIPHLGTPTAFLQPPNPGGDMVPSTCLHARCFLYPASDSRNSWEPELLQENHRFKAFGDCLFFFFFFLPAEHLFPAEEQSSLHSFLPPPFPSSFQKCKAPVLRPCHPSGTEPALPWGTGLREAPLWDAPREFLGFHSKPESSQQLLQAPHSPQGMPTVTPWQLCRDNQEGATAKAWEKKG